MARGGARREASRIALSKAAGLTRIAGRVFFLAPGAAKFLDHAGQVDLFRHWGVPAPGFVVYAVGAIEIVLGLLLAAGVAMPVPALVLAVDMLGALVIAGVVDGRKRILLPVAVLALLAFVLSRWGGAWQVGGRLQLTGRRMPT